MGGISFSAYERLEKENKSLRAEVETWKDRAAINGNLGFKYQDETHVLRAQLAEAREILEEYSGPDKMSETHTTLLNRFERWRNAARAYLEKYK